MCFSPVIQAGSGPCIFFCHFTCQLCLDDATLQASLDSPDTLTPASESLPDVCTLNICLTFVSKGEKQGTNFLATVNVRPDPAGLCPGRPVHGSLVLWVNDCVAKGAAFVILSVSGGLCEWGFLFSFDMPCSLWDLSSPTRDPAQVPAVSSEF